MQFEYVATNRLGVRVVGSLAAETERAAIAMLDEKGLLPIRLLAAKITASSRVGRSVKPRIMANCYRQLSDLLRAGVPLLKALEILERQISNPSLSPALADVRKAVADGTGLAESMAAHPKLFTDLARGMIAAGQEGGFLEDVLARIADYTEQEEELKGKVLGALAYPIFLSIVGALVIGILVIFFVPKFETVFARLKAKGQLPVLTIGLLETSNFLQRYGLVMLGLFVAGAFAFKQWMTTPKARERVDRFKLKAPAFGPIHRDLAIVRFSRVLGTMLANGIPIIKALRMAKDSCGNILMSRAIADAANNVTGGVSLTAPLSACGLFPRDIIERIAIAEESNTLERVLVDIADGTEKQTTRRLELLVKMLEPVMLLVMAAITLVVVAALLLPVLRMSTALK